jgi:hypothetical protein
MSFDHSTNVLGVAQIKSSINLQCKNIRQLKMVSLGLSAPICKLQTFEASYKTIKKSHNKIALPNP